MSKISYTWYPKDWTFSDKVFELDLAERGLYRELIDLAMINDNKTEVHMKGWARKWGATHEEINAILEKLDLLGLIETYVDEYGILRIKVPSCEPRLNLKRGGRKGGLKSRKPKKEVKPKKVVPKPSLKPMKERAEDFRQLIAENKEGYKGKMLQDFYNYWTEAGPSDRKMRYEKQTSFDVKRRLQTWARRELEHKKSQRI